MIALDKVTDSQLLEMAFRKRAPDVAAKWPRGRLIQYIDKQAPKVKVKTRMKRNLGVRKFVYTLLERVVGETDDGLPIGLGYKKIVEMTHKKFPDSAVDKLHVRWYANKYRADGGLIPVHRERSRWK